MEMKKRYLSVFLLLILLGCLLFGVGGAQMKTQREKAMEYVRLSLFCDVDFWRPPKWETKNGSITGEISDKTGVIVDTNIPAQDADKQLSLQLMYGELPDMVSVVNDTLISQLVDSGKVWDLEEFFKTYLPDSHILKDFPEDIREKLMERDGGWYAWPSHIDSEDARKHWVPSAKCYVDEEKYLWNTGIIWNRELLNKLDISADECKTKAQLLEAFAKAREWNL